MAIGVADREQRVLRLIIDDTIGLVVALPLFVLDDAALLVELLLRHRAEQMPHAVAFHEQSQVERTRRDRLDIVGMVEPGRSVGRGRSRRLARSEEHTSELQSLMRISYAVFGLKQHNTNN